jgi:hypothetical protein
VTGGLAREPVAHEVDEEEIDEVPERRAPPRGACRDLRLDQRHDRADGIGGLATEAVSEDRRQEREDGVRQVAIEPVDAAEEPGGGAAAAEVEHRHAVRLVAAQDREGQRVGARVRRERVRAAVREEDDLARRERRGGAARDAEVARAVGDDVERGDRSVRERDAPGRGQLGLDRQHPADSGRDEHVGEDVLERLERGPGPSHAASLSDKRARRPDIVRPRPGG